MLAHYRDIFGLLHTEVAPEEMPALADDMQLPVLEATQNEVHVAEKRDAFRKLAELVERIVNPADNVTQIDEHRGERAGLAEATQALPVQAYSLSGCPPTSLSLLGRSTGRTIPLAEIDLPQHAPRIFGAILCFKPIYEIS